MSDIIKLLFTALSMLIGLIILLYVLRYMGINLTLTDVFDSLFNGLKDLGSRLKDLFA